MPNDPSSTIDNFLRGRGSPLEGLGNVFVAAGRKYGVDPRLVVSISGIESSFGKHINGNFNAWGWGPGRPFGSWEEGIQTVTRGLKTGYYDRGLRTPDQIVKRYAPGSDGNDEGNWAKVVSDFMNQMGAATTTTPSTSKTKTVPSSVPQTPPTLPPGTGVRQAALANLATVASRGGKADPIGMMLSMAQGFALDQQIAQQMASAGKKGGEKAAAPPPPPSTPGDWADWVGPIAHREGPSPPHGPEILQFVGQVGQLAGTVLTPWGNESHSTMTVNGRRSAHADGNAADIPASGAELIRLGQTALVAAGMPPAKARKQRGGLFNVGGYQVIFNTQIGGNHRDHLHVGLRR